MIKETMEEEGFRPEDFEQEELHLQDDSSFLGILEHVALRARESQLKEEFLCEVSEEARELMSFYELSAVQTVLLSLLMNAPKPISLANMSMYLDCCLIRMLRYEDEMGLLVERGICLECMTPDAFNNGTLWSYDRQFLNALRKGEKYFPEELVPEPEEDLAEELGLLEEDVARPNFQVRSAAKIQEKSLFYNERETAEINRLYSLLEEENFRRVQERLRMNGMRDGFACLLYGAPGTGKTETVLQMARRTGRDILQVSVSEIRDKYVGESEKRIRAVFAEYRRMVESAKGPVPILLFNEADSIFSRRRSVNSSADQAENSVQNILLEEMESLSGILLATTNLTDNLDAAFERRFLYKVRFDRPSVEVRQYIWQSMMKGLSSEDALRLAREFDFSGGQIENVSRKHLVDSILFDREPGYEGIREYCQAEHIESGRQKRAIGFTAG